MGSVRRVGRLRLFEGRGRWRAGLLAAAFAIFAAAPAAAQEQPFADFDYYATLFGLLVGALVVATVLESALTVLFNWRIYRTVFNGRAWKTVFMLLGAWVIVGALHYNIVEMILDAVTGEPADNAALAVVAPAGPPVDGEVGGRSDFGLTLLSVMFLAGGSAGVHNVLQRFGYRSPFKEAEPPALDETEAWVSVTVVRRKAKGPIEVHIDEIPPDPDATYDGPIAGVLDDAPVLVKAWRMMFARPMRYPPYGGRKVRTTKVYSIRVTGEGIGAGEGKVFEGRFASRAVVDFIKTV